MSVSFKRLLIASKNKGKLNEFASLFHALGVDVLSLHDVPDLGDVAETGLTFRENAELKARTIAARTGLPVLADDSGLCVEALAGAPGVFSARYGGEHGNDGKNNARLLAELARACPRGPGAASDGTPYWSAAKFVCALVLVPAPSPAEDGAGRQAELAVEGECHGLILAEPRGQGGFGYDPLFYIPALGKSMAELSIEEKNRISHRSRALVELMHRLTNRS